MIRIFTTHALELRVKLYCQCLLIFRVYIIGMLNIENILKQLLRSIGNLQAVKKNNVK